MATKRKCPKCLSVLEPRGGVLRCVEPLCEWFWVAYLGSEGED